MILERQGRVLLVASVFEGFSAQLAPSLWMNGILQRNIIQPEESEAMEVNPTNAYPNTHPTPSHALRQKCTYTETVKFDSLRWMKSIILVIVGYILLESKQPLLSYLQLYKLYKTLAHEMIHQLGCVEFSCRPEERGRKGTVFFLENSTEAAPRTPES